MRYRLRTLMAVVALGPPLLAGVWLTLSWVASDRELLGVFLIASMICFAFVVYGAGAIAVGAAAAWIADTVFDALSGRPRQKPKRLDD